jgi:DNA mismatch endonuclease (patch repair protein)
MADFLDPAQRSELMSKIRGKNTKVELLVYKFLRRENIHFQRHYRAKFGVRLDVALPRKKRAVFIDGDFWHGRTLDRVIERRGPYDFWTRKLMRNIERDKQQAELLIANDWTFIRVWESDLTKKLTQEAHLGIIKKFLVE